MTYIKTEDSLSFLVNGEMYMVTKEDNRYEELCEALRGNENEEVLMDIYYKQLL